MNGKNLNFATQTTMHTDNMNNIQPQLLDDEISFKLYSLNRLIQQTYQDYLVPLGITYPQYLVMKILFEEDGIPVNVISARLMLESNTVTPLLQRMERLGLISRGLRCSDQRQRIISLTEKGKNMRMNVSDVSARVATSLSEMNMSCPTAENLGRLLTEFITKMR